MSREHEEKTLSTADLVSAADETQGRREAPRSDTVRAEPAQAVEDVQVRDVQDDRIEQGTQDDRRAQRSPDEDKMEREPATMQDEPLDALFDPELSHDFRMHWTNVQIGFVDDPKRAVQQADELVAQVMKSLAESFARQRAEIEAGVSAGEQTSTENLRVALRRYRSFFERLLTL